MALLRTFGLSLVLFVVAAHLATSMAARTGFGGGLHPQDGQTTPDAGGPGGVGETGTDGRDGKRGAPDAGPCPLPKLEDATALGNLTAIVAATRLNGSQLVGSTGDVSATGRACLAVYVLDGEYNVFYSVAVSASVAGEPTSVSIGKGATGDAGTTVFDIVTTGDSTTWTNLTGPPPPPLKKNKKKGSKTPAPPHLKYTYATNGTWLKASTLTTSDGSTYKELVDAIVAGADGYYATFLTTAYVAGAARGQFKNESLPEAHPLPPPGDKKDGKKGGEKDGKKDGKKGDKKGGKDGKGKKDGPFDPSLGTLVGVVAARLNGSNADLTGDVTATGAIALAIFLTNTSDYNILYNIGVTVSTAGEPTSVVINSGADVALTVVSTGATWTNETMSDADLAKLSKKMKKDKKKKGPPPPVGYSYSINGTWLSASTLTADNGQTYKELADAMLAAPASYAALVNTEAFSSGAESGALVNITKGAEGLFPKGNNLNGKFLVYRKPKLGSVWYMEGNNLNGKYTVFGNSNSTPVWWYYRT